VSKWKQAVFDCDGGVVVSTAHIAARRRWPSLASALVVIFAAIVIGAAAILTFELIAVEAGLDDIGKAIALEMR